MCAYGEAICAKIADLTGTAGTVNPIKYSIATEHEHSCCILLAREDKFLIDGQWWTWIDYDKFNALITQYYAENGDAYIREESEISERDLFDSSGASETKTGSTLLSQKQRKFTFTSLDYMAPTPSWAMYQSEEKGFDPIEKRWRRKNGKIVANEYKPSESGCG